MPHLAMRFDPPHTSVAQAKAAVLEFSAWFLVTTPGPSPGGLMPLEVDWIAARAQDLANRDRSCLAVLDAGQSARPPGKRCSDTDLRNHSTRGWSLGCGSDAPIQRSRFQGYLRRCVHIDEDDLLIVSAARAQGLSDVGGFGVLFRRDRQRAWHEVDVLRPRPHRQPIAFGMSEQMHGEMVLVGDPNRIYSGPPDTEAMELFQRLMGQAYCTPSTSTASELDVFAADGIDVTRPVDRLQDSVVGHDLECARTPPSDRLGPDQAMRFGVLRRRAPEMRLNSSRPSPALPFASVTQSFAPTDVPPPRE